MSRILLIEDEIELAENIATILEINGYTVTTAFNGKEGLRLAREMNPDLIISDIVMPEMNGYELLSELRNDPETASVPLIFLTAKVDYKDLRYGMELGADDYIYKPFKAAQLIGAVRTRLQRLDMMKTGTVQSSQGIEEDKYRTDDVILLEINGMPVFTKIMTICCIQSERQYTKVYLQNGKSVLKRKSLNEWVQILPAAFIRVHRSFIINVNFIKKIEKLSPSQYRILLSNEIKVISSRRYTNKLKSLYSV